MNLKLVSAFGLLALATVANAAEFTQQCNQKCEKQKENENEIASCQRGCRFYSLKNSAERSIFSIFSPQRNTNDVLVKCTNDCSLSYKNDKESSACNDGCHWMKDSSSNDAIFDFGDGGIRITFGSLPGQITDELSGVYDNVKQMMNSQHQQLQKMMVGGPKSDDAAPRADVEVKDGMFGNFFQSVHNQMKDMMQSLVSPDTEVRGEDGKLVHGGGELVVVRSGPGYHEKKTYQLGPDADIEKILDSNMDDMLGHDNPIEKFMNDEMVEQFVPKLNADSEVKVADNIFDSDPWGLIGKLGFGGDKKERQLEPLEGPRLPETGLKSRHSEIPLSDIEFPTRDHGDLRRVFMHDVCAQPCSEMTWNQWISCMHVKMGVPHWLLVGSLVLGVIFTLWLCLVIPSNAPKQRIRKPKNLNVKEVEANATVATVGQQQVVLDLPPSYDDVTKNELEPVHEFNAKIVLEDDEDILEPLPNKKGIEEEKNCSNV